MTTEGRLAFDIETERNVHRIPEIPEPEVLTGNLRDPEKIREKIEAARTAQLDKAALDAHFGRVLAVGLAFRHPLGDDIQTDCMVRHLAGDDRRSVDDAERSLLTWFWDKVRTWNRYTTFNGSAFDVPFLLRRSLLLKVRPVLIPIHKYHVTDPRSEHLDVYQALTQYDVGNGNGNALGYRRSQHFYAREILGITPPYGEEINKAELGDLHRAGQHELIAQMVTWDASTTLQLAEAVEPVLV